MVPVFTVLFIVGVSVLVTRIATVALTHTGVAKPVARFQARSAFTGAGFTTQETESVVKHPVRRKIIMLLMLLGNVGIVSVLASLVLTFLSDHSYIGWPVRLAILIGGIGFLWWFASSQWVDRGLSRLISRMLRRWTDLDVRDYDSILRLSEDYDVVELKVEPQDWLAGNDLAELRLRDEGVIVLGVSRADGSYVGAPNGDTRLYPGDTITMYGHVDTITELDRRRRDVTGDVQHYEQVRAQAERIEQENREDEEDAEHRGGDDRSAA